MTNPLDALPGGDASPKHSDFGASPELTDTGNATRFVRAYGELVRFCQEFGWLYFDGKCWVRDELGVRELAIRSVCSIFAEAANVSGQAAQKAIVDHARKSQSARSIQGLLWCAQPFVSAVAGLFDANPWVLPANNGTLDLRTGTLGAHDREHYSTRCSRVDFDPAATCPTWTAFLQRVVPDSEVRELLKRLAGYSLTGATTEQVLVFLYGAGRNGKSVFVEVLAELLGEYHTATRIETLSSLRGGGIPNDIAALHGARLITVSETPEGSRLNESLVKDLTGGDTITARFLRREYFQFRPQGKIWIRGNHKPQIRGTDDGIWRRLLLIPFTVQIPPDEVDPKLAEKLRAELPGILNWALEGCLSWQESGLCVPDKVTEAVSDYRAEMDTLGAFISDRCYVNPAARAAASALYRAYAAWCDASGHNPVSSMRFGLALGERGFEKRKPKTVIWHGIGLQEEPHGPPDPHPAGRG